MTFKKILTKPGYEVSTIEDIPTKRIPTIRDLAKFTGGFETFRPDIYQLEKSDGSGLQDLTGYGFADKDSLEMARKGEMTKEVADNRLISILENEKQNWLQYLPETSKLPIETQMALWDTSYNGKGVQGTIKNSPKLVQAIKNYLPGNRKLLEAVVEQMDHSKSASGWLGARSAARRAMALGEYDWNWPTLDKYGRQVDYNKYKGPKDYLSSPYIGKYQSGGLVYKPYLPDNQENIETDYNEYWRNLASNLHSSIHDYDVEQVKIYQPVDVTRTEPTKPQVDNTRVAKQPVMETPVSQSKGRVYKSSEKEEFKQTMFNTYYDTLLKRGLDEENARKFAQRITSQDILESNWGQSSLARDFNFGGVKDFRKNKDTAVRDTTEYKNGVKQTVKQPFRKFNDLQEYIDYKINLLDNTYHVFNYTPESMFDNLVRGKKKYATDPKYAEKLNNLNNKIW